ncbi:MAG: carboxypeptidase regulatory-like domain-containing protein, partial [Methanophagales archaeon]|nr:carboxypeptidase regulatory-like domain-containing protein [Methanophagales archaeon]
MKKIGIVLAISIALILVANSVVVAYSLQKGEEAGIVEYSNGQQVIGLQKTKMDNYTDSQSKIKALSSVPPYYDNFTMLIGEKKCSSTYNPPICASPGSGIVAVYVYWHSHIYGCPKFIDFSSALNTYCLKILKPAELGTYKFQVEYYRGFNRDDISLSRKINITVNITECHNCCILTGLVTDFGGNPVSNAEIHVKNRDYESIDYHTNLTGFYSTCPLRNGTYTVYYVPPPSDVNLLDKVVTATITKNTTLNITLQCGGILAGRVTYENGTGIHNARVAVTGPSSWSAYTNTTGYYSIINLLAGNYTVTADPPSGVDLPSNFTNASITLGETTFVDLVLHSSPLNVS